LRIKALDSIPVVLTATFPQGGRPEVVGAVYFREEDAFDKMEEEVARTPSAPPVAAVREDGAKYSIADL
jgi:hypothetical protein